MRNLIWVVVAVVALVLIGMVVMSVLGTLLKFAFYLLIGAIVVGGGIYLAGRARGAIRGNRWRQLP